VFAKLPAVEKEAVVWDLTGSLLSKNAIRAKQDYSLHFVSDMNQGGAVFL
jgi:hypothetical protein